MISEEQRMQEEAQLQAIKQTKQRLRREQLQAWGNESPSPLTFQSPDGNGELVLDFLSPEDRGERAMAVTSPNLHGHPFGFRDRDRERDREKRGGAGGGVIGGQESTVSGSSSLRRGTSKDSKMTTIPCQRKPSRSLLSSFPPSLLPLALEPSLTSPLSPSSSPLPYRCAMCPLCCVLCAAVLLCGLGEIPQHKESKKLNN
jgi:hypothetical protein